MDTRLLGKPGDSSGAQDAWRDWSAVLKGHAGAAVPRLQLTTKAAKATTPIFNATILDEVDRAASAQLCWMMLTICKGAALTIAFLGDSEGLEAWKQLTEKYEAKIRTRFSGQLMSILSSSLQGDATERTTAWEWETVTCEIDGGKVLDDEIKIGTFLLRLPESQLKTHLLMRVDTLKKCTDFRGEVVAISRAIATAQAQPTPMVIEAMSKVTPSKGGKGAKEITRQRTALTSTRRAEKCGKGRSVTLRTRVDLLAQTSSPRRKEAARRRQGGQGRQRCRCSQNVLELL